MEEQKGETVLISGCSSGIGFALADEFIKQGRKVIATARNIKSIEYFTKLGAFTLGLDVTDPRSINKCIGTVIKKFKRIDILVNNAGYNVIGPLAEVDMSDVKNMFDTNVMGLLELTQAVAPHMIEARRGKIINISSIVGILATPYAGPYCASKAAVNSLSDALRMELSPFGIEVITVQPGSTRSKLGDKASKGLEKYKSKKSNYWPVAEDIKARARYSQQNPMSSEEFACRVVKKVLSPSPPVIIRTGKEAFKIPFLKAVLPIRVMDGVLSRKFGLSKLIKIQR